MTVVGIALFGLGFVVDAGPGPTASNTTITIVRPSPNEQLPAGQPVDVVVEVRNGDLALSPSDPEGGHLHLYVDGQLRQMYSAHAEITLVPGPHEVRVEYVDAGHVSFSPKISSTIRVEAV